MTHPVDAKRSVLEAIAADLKAWIRRKPTGYREEEAARFVSLAEDAMLLPSAIHLATAEGHVAMALAWRAKGPLNESIPKARAWLKGELEEAARNAMEAANPAAWSEPRDRLDVEESA